MTDILALDVAALEAQKQIFESNLAELKERTYAPDDRQQLSDFLAWVQGELVAAEKDREGLTKPINKDLRRINSAYKSMSEPGERLKAFLTDKIGELELEAEGARALAEERAHDHAENGEYEAAMLVLQEAPEATKTSGVRTAFEWVGEVVDKAAVPEIYKIVDEGLIKAAAKAFADSKTPPTIPGIKFERVAKVAPTGKKKKE